MNLKSSIFEVSASPEQAQSDWERFLAAYQEEKGRPFNLKSPALSSFLRIFGNSQFLTRWVIRRPQKIDSLFKSRYLKKQKTVGDHSKELGKLPSSSVDEWLKEVRGYKYFELLRMTLRDLSGTPCEKILVELSSLATALLIATNQKIYESMIEKWGNPTLSSGQDCSYQLVALGKLGGFELNYSSDVDLLAVIQTDEAQTPETNAHEFFVRHVQQLTTALQARTDDGFLYRVDWDLRPEGKAGTLVNSMPSLWSYYETFGADWERQALTKARPLVGSKELGESFLKMIKPFVYRKYFDLDALQRILSMKEKIHGELLKKTDTGFNVKLGVGGIREIEFFVQSFLLIYGGRKPELRCNNTLETLNGLRKARLVSREDAHKLHDAYLFLRKLEHRLQLVNEAQTHTLPKDDQAQLQAARRMGYHQKNPEQALNAFQSDLAEMTKNVGQLFGDLFAEKEPEAPTNHAFTIPSAAIAPIHSYREFLKDKLSKVTLFEHKLNEIRLFKRRQTEKILNLETKLNISRQDILYRLSLLAEAICQEALVIAIEELQPRYGLPMYFKSDKEADQSHLLVLGMGKLGGYEINYTSDLDVIFIYSENGETTGPQKVSNAEYFFRLVQKFISILSVTTATGYAYQIDAELRPSGNFGTLVTTLESFMQYQNTTSQIWERQSLLRARPIAGPASLAHLVQRHLNVLLFSKPFPQDIRHEMHRLRMRVEKEVAKEHSGWFDFKVGKGGIMDIEFILQLYQLCYGTKHAELRTGNTFETLDQLNRLRLLPQSSDAVLLKEIYTFYRNLEAQVALVAERGLHRLFSRGELLKKVAPKLGLENEQVLLEQYYSCRDRVRNIYEGVFVAKGCG